MSSTTTTRARSSSLRIINAVPSGLEEELLDFPPTTRARSSSLGVINAVPSGLEEELLGFPPEGSTPELLDFPPEGSTPGARLQRIVESAQPDGQRIDLVLVPGLEGNPFSEIGNRMWKKENSDTVWVRDLLREKLDNFNLHLYQYEPRGLEQSFGEDLNRCIRSSATRLLKSISDTLVDLESNIVLIGNGFGGLIVKQALIYCGGVRADGRPPTAGSSFGENPTGNPTGPPYLKFAKEHIAGVIFIGTPHRGWKTSLGDSYYTQAKIDPDLQDLRSYASIASPVPLGYPVGSDASLDGSWREGSRHGPHTGPYGHRSVPEHYSLETLPGVSRERSRSSTSPGYRPSSEYDDADIFPGASRPRARRNVSYTGPGGRFGLGYDSVSAGAASSHPDSDPPDDPALARHRGRVPSPPAVPLHRTESSHSQYGQSLRSHSHLRSSSPPPGRPRSPPPAAPRPRSRVRYGPRGTEIARSLVSKRAVARRGYSFEVHETNNSLLVHRLLGDDQIDQLANQTRALRAGKSGPTPEPPEGQPVSENMGGSRGRVNQGSSNLPRDRTSTRTGHRSSSPSPEAHGATSSTDDSPASSVAPYRPWVKPYPSSRSGTSEAGASECLREGKPDLEAPHEQIFDRQDSAERQSSRKSEYPRNGKNPEPVNRPDVPSSQVVRVGPSAQASSVTSPGPSPGPEDRKATEDTQTGVQPEVRDLPQPAAINALILFRQPSLPFVPQQTTAPAPSMDTSTMAHTGNDSAVQRVNDRNDPKGKASERGPVPSIEGPEISLPPPPPPIVGGSHAPSDPQQSSAVSPFFYSSSQATESHGAIEPFRPARDDSPPNRPYHRSEQRADSGGTLADSKDKAGTHSRAPPEAPPHAPYLAPKPSLRWQQPYVVDVDDEPQPGDSSNRLRGANRSPSPSSSLASLYVSRGSSPSAPPTPLEYARGSPLPPPHIIPPAPLRPMPYPIGYESRHTMAPRRRTRSRLHHHSSSSPPSSPESPSSRSPVAPFDNRNGQSAPSSRRKNVHWNSTSSRLDDPEIIRLVHKYTPLSSTASSGSVGGYSRSRSESSRSEGRYSRSRYLSAKSDGGYAGSERDMQLIIYRDYLPETENALWRHYISLTAALEREVRRRKWDPLHRAESAFLKKLWNDFLSVCDQYYILSVFAEPEKPSPYHYAERPIGKHTALLNVSNEKFLALKREQEDLVRYEGRNEARYIQLEEEICDIVDRARSKILAPVQEILPDEGQRTGLPAGIWEGLRIDGTIRRLLEKHFPREKDLHAETFTVSSEWEPKRPRYKIKGESSCLHRLGDEYLWSGPEGEQKQQTGYLWVHIPGNDRSWAKAVVARIHSLRSSDIPLEIMSDDYWKKMERRYTSRRDVDATIDLAGHQRSASTTYADAPRFTYSYMQPSCHTPKLAKEWPPQLVLYLPYLHWSYEADQKDQACALEAFRLNPPLQERYLQAINDPLKRLRSFSLADAPDALRHHPRRTLDQYYYQSINTETRDGDQIVYHWTKKETPTEPKVLMVDQLWVCVTSFDTIFTFFPQNLKENEGDRSFADLKESLVEGLQSLQTDCQLPCDDALDMAAYCLHQAVTALLGHDESNSDVPVMRIFRNTLDETYELAVQAFNDFVEKPDEELGVSHDLKLYQKACDIQDELQMLRHLFREQHIVIQQFITDIGQLSSAIEGVNATNTATLALKRLEEFDAEAEKCCNSSRSTKSYILVLLDLKQKASGLNVALSTADQGRTMMIFTVFTIVFLPLSFFAAIYGMNISEWSGVKTNPNANTMLLYMVSISTVVISLALSVAFFGWIKKRIKRFWGSEGGTEPGMGPGRAGGISGGRGRRARGGGDRHAYSRISREAIELRNTWRLMRSNSRCNNNRDEELAGMV